ncbi:MAG TPA: biotin transporter BioY [Bacillota bacterium]|nr:biotin transporter BioY [Bacillota bacterium]
MKTIRPIDLTFGAIFVCMMGIGANIAVWFPFLVVPIGGAAVPLSLQTFFAILSGLILGKTRGTLAMIAYIFIGVSGVPVFAGMTAGPVQLISPTGGFILSFVIVTFTVGSIVEKVKKLSLPLCIFASITGFIFNYLIGVTYMYVAMKLWLDIDITYITAWAGMLPFLLKDALLSPLAGVFVDRLTKRIPVKWQKTA